MQQKKFRTVLRSTVSAVILMPALAFAQSNSNGSSDTGAQGAGAREVPEPATRGSSAQGSSAQGSSAQGSSAQGSTGGTSSSSRAAGSTSGAGQGSSMAGSSAAAGTQGSSSSSTARQSIDPAEVQRVFGTDATVVDLQSLDQDQIRSVQQSLQERGHYKGAIDGVYGPQTRAAIKAMLSQQYSLNQRLINQGQVTGPLASSMGIDQSGMTNVGGSDLDSPGMDRTQPTTRPQPSGATGSPNTGSSSSSGTDRSGSGSPSGSSSPGNTGTGNSGSPSGSSSGSGTPR